MEGIKWIPACLRRVSQNYHLPLSLKDSKKNCSNFFHFEHLSLRGKSFLLVLRQSPAPGRHFEGITNFLDFSKIELYKKVNKYSSEC